MGTASIEDKEYFEETCKKVIKTRARVTDELRLLGFDVLDSQTNFVFATHNEHNMKSLFEYLKTQKVFIRYFSLPRIENYVRITIGTDREMDIFLEKTKEFILNDSKQKRLNYFTLDFEYNQYPCRRSIAI